jgi:hypothetical protein
MRASEARAVHAASSDRARIEDRFGAAAFQIDDWDHRASDWAREHTPVFGSQRDAERWRRCNSPSRVNFPLSYGSCGSSDRFTSCCPMST